MDRELRASEQQKAGSSAGVALPAGGKILIGSIPAAKTSSSGQ